MVENNNLGNIPPNRPRPDRRDIDTAADWHIGMGCPVW